MTVVKKVLLLLCGILLALSFAACKKEEPMEKVGEKAGEAVEETQEMMKEAGEEMEEAAEEAGEMMKEAGEEMEEAAEEAGKMMEGEKEK